LPLLVKGGLASCCASCYAHSPPQENESIAGQQENRKSQPVKSCKDLCWPDAITLRRGSTFPGRPCMAAILPGS
jgi:hypothetical protein